MAHPQHEQVRERYASRCGYCEVSEADVGGSLTVDHFQPSSAGGTDNEDNLVYACFKCNQYKGPFVPNETDVREGHRVLHPRNDPVDEHTRFNDQTGLLEGLTPTGRFHIALLQLNRPALVQHRLQRCMAKWLMLRHEMLEDEVAMLTSTITGLELHISRLERLLEPPPN